jgi:hypothetical protein
MNEIVTSGNANKTTYQTRNIMDMNFFDISRNILNNDHSIIEKLYPEELKTLSKYFHINEIISNAYPGDDVNETAHFTYKLNLCNMLRFNPDFIEALDNIEAKCKDYSDNAFQLNLLYDFIHYMIFTYAGKHSTDTIRRIMSVFGSNELLIQGQYNPSQNDTIFYLMFPDESDVFYITSNEDQIKRLIDTFNLNVKVLSSIVDVYKKIFH